MALSKNLEIIISILFALRGIPSANCADSTAIAGSGGESSSANAAGGELTTAPPDDLATVSIFDAPAYSIAAGCVRECLMQEFQPGVPDGLILAAALGCTSPYYNGCYCTSAVASSASSLLSRCIVAECSGTSEVPDAFSIYNNYCTTAGYPGPATNIAKTTTANIAQSSNPAQNSGLPAQPSTTIVSGAVIYTVTNAGSTFLITETGVQTVISTPTSSPLASSVGSGGGGGGSKVNVGAIVGGVLGALLLITILLGVFLIWLPRRQKKKDAEITQSGVVVRTQPNMPGAEESTFVPCGVPVQRRGGRAELPEKGGVEVSEKEEVKGFEEKDKEGVVGQKEGVEVDGAGLGELGGEGRYGLRPEELDSEGRYVGELHGDGRQFGGVELEGREVR